MGLSLYYSATRAAPLSPAERHAIDELIERYSVDDQIDEYCRSGRGLNWQSFCVYDLDYGFDPHVVFEGATGLPSNTHEAPYVGLRHWCKLLTEIRRKIDGCSWRVHVDDCEIKWDHAKNSYDTAL